MSRGRQYQLMIQRLEDLGVDVWRVPGEHWDCLLDELPMDNLSLVQRAREIQNDYEKLTANDPT
jgi:hypothetical protein